MQPAIGSYLTALGLLRALPGSHGWWERDEFMLDVAREDAVEYLLNHTPGESYSLWWGDDIVAARNVGTDDQVRCLDAHLVFGADGEVRTNLILAFGGRLRNANFGKAALQAREAIDSANIDQRREWLRNALWGERATGLPDIVLSSYWWPAGNRISPYSMLLALEGALLMAPGATRQLLVGSKRPFPWLVWPLEEEQLAEFWAPIWRQPACAREVAEALYRNVREQQSNAMDLAIDAASGGTAPGADAFIRFALQKSGKYPVRWITLRGTR